ncbi:hypothetical protein [Mesorhizobium sp.]|uniref:ATP-dependent DNA ligase n=1 Tax=Mesorhizobium sp. TaxID=1871066 RepID=UPI0025CDA9D0|nr:hypothetical protein [Mesorhizobium sp.]
MRKIVSASARRLEFIKPMMPTLVAKPPQGDDWMHKAKFGGYRSQIIIDDGGARIFTRRGLDWTSKYRDLAAAARTLDVENAIIDGEVVVLMRLVFRTLPRCARQSPGASTTSISSPSMHRPQGPSAVPVLAFSVRP